ncbi:hypothetical protein ES705_46803 [subsurface metagenome]
MDLTPVQLFFSLAEAETNHTGSLVLHKNNPGKFPEEHIPCKFFLYLIHKRNPLHYQQNIHRPVHQYGLLDLVTKKTRFFLLYKQVHSRRLSHLAHKEKNKVFE